MKHLVLIGVKFCQYQSFIQVSFPEVKVLLDAGIHREQYHFRLDGSQIEKIYSGSSPFNDGTVLTTLKEPRESYPIPSAPIRPEEFAPGLDPDLQELAYAFTEFKESIKAPKKISRSQKNNLPLICFESKTPYILLGVFFYQHC